MATCFESIPYFELIEGLLDEVSILNSQKNEILEEFDDRLQGSRVQIKKLLLVKETFDRKIELGNLKEEINL